MSLHAGDDGSSMKSSDMVKLKMTDEALGHVRVREEKPAAAPRTSPFIH